MTHGFKNYPSFRAGASSRSGNGLPSMSSSNGDPLSNRDRLLISKTSTSLSFRRLAIYLTVVQHTQVFAELAYTKFLGLRGTTSGRAATATDPRHQRRWRFIFGIEFIKYALPLSRTVLRRRLQSNFEGTAGVLAQAYGAAQFAP